MSTHTPGPWHFVPDNAGRMIDDGYGILFGEPDSWGWEKNLFVSVGCSGNVRRALGKGVPEANARLIAAAPALKDGCNALLGLLELICARDDVPAAIRHILLDNHRVDEARAAIAKAEGTDR